MAEKKRKAKDKKPIDKGKARYYTCIVCPACCELEPTARKSMVHDAQRARPLPYRRWSHLSGSSPPLSDLKLPGA